MSVAVGIAKGSLAAAGGMDYYLQLEALAVKAARDNNAALWYVGRQNSFTGTVFQDSTGTTPATGTDPIGLLLDRSYGTGNLGAELISNPGGPFTSTTGYVGALTASVSVLAGELIVTTPAVNDYAVINVPTVVGVTYRVSIVLRRGPGVTSVNVGCLSPSAIASTTSLVNTQIQVVFTATLTTSQVYVQNGVGSGTINVVSVSTKQLIGYPAFQATAGSRPLLELQANGYYGMRFDGTNDFLLDNLLLSNTANHTLIAAANVTNAGGYRTLAVGAGAPIVRVAQLRLEAATGRIDLVYVTDTVTISEVVGSVNLVGTKIVASGTLVSGTATVRVNGNVAGSVAVNSGTSTVSTGAIGSFNAGGDESMLGLIYLVCKSPNAMPAPDRIAIERFAALLSGATYTA